MSRQPFLGILLAIVVGMAARPPSTDATAITVTTSVDELSDNGSCSLREMYTWLHPQRRVAPSPARESGSLSDP